MSTIASSQKRTGYSLDNLFRKALLTRLARLEGAALEIADPLGHQVVGAPAADLAAKLTVHDMQFYHKAALGGSVAAAESYMQGEWSTDDLTSLIRVFARNQDLLDQLEGGMAAVANAALRVPHWLRRNSTRGSRRNISLHYDLGNDFFAAFLDEQCMYSSATFLRREDSLEQASLQKLDRICRKLELTPADSLVEIGTGWGGFACFAAAHYGCEVTTTTISREQFDAASSRVQAEGLGDCVKVLMQDYRHLDGKYDKLASIEMIEAVGHQYLDAYFTKCAELLKPSGSALIQAITLEDRHYERSLKSVDFIKRFIFPGSFIPSVSAIVGSACKRTDLRLVNLEDQGESYARTIAAWRERFESSLPTIRQMGYSEEFIRMWRFYLAYCEGGFLERTISSAQLLFAKPGNRSSQWLAQ